MALSDYGLALESAILATLTHQRNERTRLRGWVVLFFAASAMASLGQNNAPISQSEYFVILGPEHAQSLAGAGLTRRDVAAYLFDHARLPAAVFRRHFEELAWDQWMKVVADDHPLPMTGEPDNIRVVVAGGPGKHSLVVPSWGVTRSVTLPVEG